MYISVLVTTFSNVSNTLQIKTSFKKACERLRSRWSCSHLVRGELLLEVLSETYQMKKSVFRLINEKIVGEGIYPVIIYSPFLTRTVRNSLINEEHYGVQDLTTFFSVYL